MILSVVSNSNEKPIDRRFSLDNVRVQGYLVKTGFS